MSFYEISYSKLACVLQFNKIYLRDAKPELIVEKNEYRQGLTYFGVYSKAKLASKLFPTKNYADVSNREDFVNFINSEHAEAAEVPGVKFLLPDDMVPRYKKAFADLLELHGVEQLAY